MAVVPLEETAGRATQDADLDLSKMSVVIPTLNEERSLPLVLNDLPQVGYVIVVDNALTDGTARAAAENGEIVVGEPVRGYGTACLCGLSFIAERVRQGTASPRVVVFLDADYGDHLDFLPQLVEPIFARRADFVLGSRLLGERDPGAMPPQSLYGIRLASFLMKVLLGRCYTDLGPFRAIDYSALRRLKMVDRNFGWTVDMQIKACRAGLRTCEVPVPYRCRIGTSKISGMLWGTVRAGANILYLIASYGLTKRR